MTMRNKNDLGKAFETLVKSFIRVHNGITCERVKDGWYVPSIKATFKTWEEVEVELDKTWEMNNFIKQQ